MDENEYVVATNECMQVFVSGETKVFLFEVIDLQSPEPDVSFSLDTKHDGKVKKVTHKIGGIRKWNEKTLEKDVYEKIKKLAPAWKERAEKLMQKMEHKQSLNKKLKDSKKNE